MERAGRSLNHYDVEAKFSASVFIRPRGECQIRKTNKKIIKKMFLRSSQIQVRNPILFFTNTKEYGIGCSSEEGGVERFKKATLHHCFASCLDLEEEAFEDKACLYTPATAKS
jgi:ribosomal protein S9